MGTVPERGTASVGSSTRNSRPISILDLQSESNRLLDASLADNTKAAYGTGLESFERFRSQYKLPKVWPPSVNSLTLYIAWLSLQGLSYRTANLYIKSLGFQCKIKGLEDVT